MPERPQVCPRLTRVSRCCCRSTPRLISTTYGITLALKSSPSRMMVLSLLHRPMKRLLISRESPTILSGPWKGGRAQDVGDVSGFRLVWAQTASAATDQVGHACMASAATSRNSFSVAPLAD